MGAPDDNRHAMTTRIIEGNLIVPAAARFAVLASRFNHFIVDRLVEGALDALSRHGANMREVVIVRVPGAWELPLIARRLAASDGVDAIIALGAVIRGTTPHFDYVAGEAAKGLAGAAHASRVPIVFGVLTTETVDQAIERAGTKQGNKGWDAATTAIEMVALARALDDAGF
jgi:6,7-dimethyl-8-ribityllumazine synthase